MKKYFTREAKIGIITIISIFLLYFGINYLRGIDIFNPVNNYYVKFANVTELQASSPIYVEGFKVGVVKSISYEQDKNDFVVQMDLEKGMKMKRGSYVKLVSSFTAGSSLHLVLNQLVDNYYEIGDTLEGRNTTGMMDVVSDKLLPQVEGMLPKIDSILTGLQTIVNHPALAQSLEHVERTTASLEQSTARLNVMMNRDLPAIVSNFKTISSDFTVVSSQLKTVDVNTPMKSLDATLKNFEQVTQKMNSKDNSLGLLLNDKDLYSNLDSTARNASLLMLDLRENPKRYVHFSIFGKK